MAETVAEKECEHHWIANTGRGGPAEFRANRMMGPEPTMHVTCGKCGDRTWFTPKQWEAMPFADREGPQP